MDPKPGTFALGPKEYPYYQRNRIPEREALYKATLTGQFRRIETAHGTLAVTIERSHDVDYIVDSLLSELIANHIVGTRCWWTPQGWAKFGQEIVAVFEKFGIKYQILECSEIHGCGYMDENQIAAWEKK